MDNYPIAGLTPKEQKVLTVIAAHGMDDYCAWLKDLVLETGLSKESAAGVVGSLVSKGHVITEERGIAGAAGVENAHDIFLFIDGEELCYGDEDGRLGDNIALARSIAEFKFLD